MCRAWTLAVAVTLAWLSMARSPAQERGAEAERAITTATLLRELGDLHRLARLAGPSYRTRQFSSTDRRSIAPEQPHWFANADGFGREPVPGFEAVLREPDAEGVGRYLICDVPGPGAIVRGWSAGMGGTLRVVLDDAGTPLYEGPAYDFLARRSRVLLERAGIELDTADVLMQQDADYLPVPFARRLRVTWEGRLRELHFYHLEVRTYEPGTPVQTFQGGEALAALAPTLAAVVDAVLHPTASPGAVTTPFTIEVPARGRVTAWSSEPDQPGTIEELELELHGTEDLEAVLRGVLLEIAFDGETRPGVLVPVGDFFASGVGVNPHESLPLTVRPDGVMISRWVMPFLSGASVSLRCTLATQVQARGHVRVAPLRGGGEVLRFHARWRHEPAIDLEGRGPIDLTFIEVLGRGRLVGVASILLNPSPVPSPHGSWWGEGDEKIFVDGESYPSFYGTGSEDYYNYSWSRPDLFAHPYCGQPVNTGPGNAGHVVNYRWHISDDVTFDERLRFDMELWHHHAVFPIGYARLACWYAIPGSADDSREPTPEECRVRPLPRWEPQARLGAARSTFYHLEDLVPADPGRIEIVPEPWASRRRVLRWTARAGAQLEVRVPIAARGEYAINLVARHRPGGAAVRVRLDGEPLPLHNPGGSAACRRGDEVIPLRSPHATRLLSLGFPARTLAAGEHRLTLECVAEGVAAFDYLWVKTLRLEPSYIPGAVEAETASIAGASPDLEHQVQEMAHDQGWSGDRHLWVRATGEGQYVDLRIPVARPGRYRVQVHLTSSYDYGILELLLEGRRPGEPVDTYSPEIRKLPAVDLGVHELDGDTVVRVRTVGSNPASRPPRYYFGVDCIVLEPVD